MIQTVIPRVVEEASFVASSCIAAKRKETTKFMGTWNGFYVRSTGDATATAIQTLFPQKKTEAGSGFIGVLFDATEFDPEAAKLSKLSSDLNTDVYWLSFQSTVDAFQYRHWRSGKILRALVYGVYQDERTWEVVEGKPEPWERDVFFNLDDLAFELKYTTDEKRKRKLERIWKNEEILVGETNPGLISNTCARKVALHYGFPGWN